MSADRYYHLGKSGLRVSRFALGTMTFGTGGIRGIGGSWGADETTSRAIFDTYLEAGGNFIDTADSYGAGTSETLVGGFISDKAIRDHVVLTTKFSNNLSPGNPNAGGNGRKNILRAVEASLTRLRTDYIDLYMLHTWDLITPAEEVVRTLDDLVRAGKIRYYGFSDVPAWYAARAVTWADVHGLSRPICLQLPYSLVERTIEHEFMSLSQELDIGITAWSPLAMGLLTGKYKSGGSGRLSQDSSGTGLGLLTERNLKIVEALEQVAQEIDRPMSQVALNWCLNRPGIAAAVVGASRPEQLRDNLEALSFDMPAALHTRLDEASALPCPLPYSLFSSAYQAEILNTGTAVGGRPEGYRKHIFIPKSSGYEFKA